MHKRTLLITMVVGMMLLGWGLARADEVLDTAMQSPLKVVKARKYIMTMFVENLQDMAKKLDGGNVKDGGVNAGNMSALAQVLPPLFSSEHKQAYDELKESKFYFKGASGKAFESEAEKLRSAAESLRQSFQRGDAMQAKSHIGALQGSCKSCHGLYRGRH
jgi:cytochrome c556